MPSFTMLDHFLVLQRIYMWHFYLYVFNLTVHKANCLILVCFDVLSIIDLFLWHAVPLFST